MHGPAPSQKESVDLLEFLVIIPYDKQQGHRKRIFKRVFLSSEIITVLNCKTRY
jgi:hypothetical protein